MDSARSPFDIEIVFKMIMDHVGSDHHSLLACRLVSHAWNRMALETLKENGASITVFKDPDGEMGIKCEAGLETYLQYRRLVESHEKNVVSAFDNLNITLNVGSREPVLIPLSIFRKVEESSPKLAITSIKYELVDHAQDPPGGHKENLRSLVLSYGSSLKYLRFNETMDIGRLTWEPVEPEAGLPFNATQFPQLESIHIELDPMRTLSTASLPILIANSSPNLRVVRIAQPPSLGSIWPNLLPIRTLLSPEAMHRIEELELPMPHWNTFPPDFFAGLDFPVLKGLVLHLEIELMENAENEEQIRNFLLHKTPRLESLQLCWVMNPMLAAFNEQIANEFLPTFPLLPNLAHFGMTNLWAISSVHKLFMSRFLKTIARKCGNIKSFSIDHRSFCQIIARQFPSGFVPLSWWLEGVTFQKVDTLKLTGPFCPHIEENESDQISVLAATMFPSLRRITIDFGPRIFDSALQIYEQCFLPGLLKVDGITTLEFKTYYSNWFGKPADAKFAHGRDLECLRLQVPRDMRIGNKFELIKPADVEKVISTLPSLKVLEMNPSLLVTNGGTNKFNEILEEMQEVRNKFPNIDIHIIKN